MKTNLKDFLDGKVALFDGGRCLCVTCRNVNELYYECNWFDYNVDNDGDECDSRWQVYVLDDGTAVTWCLDES